MALDSPTQIAQDHPSAEVASVEVQSPLLELELASGESLSVKRFAVEQRLSAPFEITLTATSPDASLDLEAIVGKDAGFLVRAAFSTQAWTGVVRHVEQMQEETSDKGISTYELHIVPTLWLLSQRSTYRIFQQRSVPEIVESILAEWGIEPVLRLAASHPKLDQRVQYGETDLAFVSRLLEEAGITYFFEEREAGAGKTQTALVLSDEPHAADPRPGGLLPYVGHPNETQSGLFVTEVRLVQDVRPGRLVLRDHDFRRPAFEICGAAAPAVSEPEEALEAFHYLPGSSLVLVDEPEDPTPTADDRGAARHDEDAASKHAQRMLEATRQGRRQVELRTNATDLVPGVVFAMSGHPRRDLGPDARLLTTGARFEGTPYGQWSLHVEAVFADVPHRPVRVTPRPVAHGPECAVVVGPAGEEIHTDELGRVRVQFPWDREGAFDERAGTWLRVSQGWSGGAFGRMNLPRIGQEVLVDFVDGDPEQPVIVGRLYAGTTRPPYSLPDGATKSTWKSDSSPHGDGTFNEITFEDAAGSELFFVQAEKAAQKLVKRNETERTGRDRQRFVGAARNTTVGAIDSHQVGLQRLVKIFAPNPANLLSMASLADLAPTATAFEMVHEKITLTTGKATIEIAGPNITIKADGIVRFTAEEELMIEGGKVYFNLQPGKETSPPVDKLFADMVPMPTGRVLGSIAQLFYAGPPGADLALGDFAMNSGEGKLLGAFAELLDLGTP